MCTPPGVDVNDYAALVGEKKVLGTLSTVAEYEEEAKRTLELSKFDFFRGGAGSEATISRNARFFERYLIVPRCLRGIRDVDLSTTVLGIPVSSPIGIAPTALLHFVHESAEQGIARACRKLNQIGTISIWSRLKISDVTGGDISEVKLFQNLYICTPGKTKAFIREAEETNRRAIVISADCAELSRRRYRLSPEVVQGIYSFNEPHRCNMPGSNWDTVREICESTRLPVVVKGLLHPQDAARAVEIGAKAVWLSNHGGRQLDSVVHPIDVLPHVLRAVDGRAEVYVDGGVRTGNDVFKCLAMGAKAVFVGRPAAYGLAVDGADGVEKVMAILNDELQNTMVLAGCQTLEDIPKTDIVRDGDRNFSRL